jgi:predicted phosphodiesterase
MTGWPPTSEIFHIGVIADTHGLFGSAIVQHFRCVDHILHAGDIGKRSVIEHLEQNKQMKNIR